MTQISAVSPSKNGSVKGLSDDEAINKVVKTYDYEKFKPMQGNRTLNPAHLKRLEESFKCRPLISPIIVNENYDVIDGQHRLSVARELGLPVYFIMIKDYGLKEVQVLNSNSHTWNKKDYLESYCQLGLRPYLQFRQFMQKFPQFSIVACGQILMDRQKVNRQLGEKKTGRFHSKEFEEGKLIISDPQKAEQTAKKILDFSPFYNGYNRKSFVATMITLFKHKNYDHDTMLKKVSTKGNPTRLVHCANVKSYVLLLEEIYNWKNRNPKSLRYGE